MSSNIPVKTMQDLYREMKFALDYFELRFSDMEKVETRICAYDGLSTEIHFTYGAKHCAVVFPGASK